jgi:probable metal-binding protein
MAESIHGHDVLHLIADAKVPFTYASLIEEIQQRWGKDARFHTCSIEGMTAKELLNFLSNRGKINLEADMITTDTSKICEH